MQRISDSIPEETERIFHRNESKIAGTDCTDSWCQVIGMDEPTAGMDVEARQEVLDLLREYMAEDETRTLLITSHISSDLETLCDDIYLIHDGKILLNEETDQILDHYGILKVSEEQFGTLDQEYLINCQK